jgi:hypothetical protein
LVYDKNILPKGGFFMGKSKYEWDQKKLQRYTDEGRGTGTGEDYKPWLTVGDFPSKGIPTKTLSWKNYRKHHFFSLNELHYFYLLEWSDAVVDIREQFPLIEFEDAIDIANSLGIKYPVSEIDGTPYILSTDFLITLKANGKTYDVARTVKPASELDRLRVLEKFEIERRYWQKRNVDWGIVTEKDISKVMAKNIEWIYSAYRLEPSDDGLDVSDLLLIGDNLKCKLRKIDSTIAKVTESLDQEMNLDRGTSLYVFMHLLSRKEIIMDMNQKINGGSPTTKIEKILIDISLSERGEIA